jgi:signal transduction histidine kinase
MHQPDTLPSPTESAFRGLRLRAVPARLAYAPAIDRRTRVGLTLLTLTLLLFAANIWALLAGQPNPAVSLFAWLVFGGLAIVSGALLSDTLHPERLASRQIAQLCSQLTRLSADPWLLLGRMTRSLHATLQTESLSLWRFQADAQVLSLLQAAGAAPADDLLELPLDLPAGQLHGVGPVINLPESALRQGLQEAGVQTVVWLTVGPELVGLVGLGPSAFQFPPEVLQQLAAQVTLLTKNVLLTADLDDTLQKLQRAYRRTIDAQDDERRNLGAELHDDVLGRLTTMALALRRSRDNLTQNATDVRQWLAGLETETQNLNRRLREITQGLHPSVLTDLGLIAGMRAYLDSLAGAPGRGDRARVITLTAQGFDLARIPTTKLERDLYYITRQAVENALKHAAAEQVFVHLRWDNDAISVTVRDTGRGMAEPPERLMGRGGHIGLLSMQERAMAWQGQLSFYTGPQQGTTVRARLPIEQPSAAPAHLQAYTQYLS